MAFVGRATAAAAVALGLALTTPAARATDSPPPSAFDQGAEIVLRALSLLGVAYRWGGNQPDTGLDCSGLVRLVFHETLGLVLPRRSEEMSQSGDQIRVGDLRPGDLVFFNTLRRTFSHVGIYIGENRFVHAPASGGVVRVERLDHEYWTRRFDGARRMVPADGQPGDGPALAAASLAAVGNEARPRDREPTRTAASAKRRQRASPARPTTVTAAPKPRPAVVAQEAPQLADGRSREIFLY